jgi:GNAT superfamily N-acetyltransferase
MITVEELTRAWRDAFLVSRNSLFTPASPQYWDRLEDSASWFPARTYIGHDETKVVAWSSFLVRELELGRQETSTIKVAMAFAVGTLPDHQRQGLGGKVWRAAEESLAQEADGVLVYTGEGGKGYPFYRAMGYVPLLYPRALRLTVSREPHTEKTGAPTAPFSEFGGLSSHRGEVFATCYQGYGGFMAGRPSSLDRWADVSFFYDLNSVGSIPQISWLENAATGRWVAYAIWAGPIEKVDWKKGVVEIWELACAEDCDLESLRRVLQPACMAARNGSGRVDWWAVPDHPLTQKMLALGFEERPRDLCVLGKVFDPARRLNDQFRTGKLGARSVECAESAGRRVDIDIDGCGVEIEHDGAMRMVLGRSTASLEHQHGLLTIRPLRKTPAVLEALDGALRIVPWCYFASEYI